MHIPRRPFRFSLLTGGAETRQEWINKACQVEDLGYDSLLFGDHVHNAMSPIAAIAAGAAQTTTLRFGSYMFGNDFRHPLLLAQEAATVDVLSDGRLDLGLGAGYLHYDYSQLGLPLDSPGTRIERLEEAVRIIKGFFAGQPFEFQGKYYQVDAGVISPGPVQKPHPPILMGGGGKRMISLAAREANIVSFNPRTTREGWFDFSSVSPEATGQKLQWFIEAAGDRASEIEISLLVPVVKITDNEREALQVLEQFLRDFSVPEGVLTTDQLRESPHIFVGSLSAVQDKFLATRERFGILHYVFFEPLEASLEIVKQLAGT
jgi:probable F420-dependent oxidoreductase